MKKFYTLALIIMAVYHGHAQIILNENFDLPIAPALPNGWTTTTLYDIGFRTDSSNFSDHAGASAMKNAVIRNSDSTGVYTLTSPIMDASNYSSVKVIWASRVSNNYLTSGSTTPLLEMSTDGGANWNSVSYVENEGNSTWALVNGGTPIDLSGAAGQSSLQLRWSVNIATDPSGTYRIDDIAVTGIIESNEPLLTIKVNMSQETISPNGVHIAGNFNAWEYDATPMTSIGSGIYQYTISLEPNSSIEFKFVNGWDVANAETVPSNCGSSDGTGGYFRTFTIGTDDATFGPVCFSQCSDCTVGVNEVGLETFTISPNPAEEFIQISSKKFIPNTHVSIYDLTGKTLQQFVIQNNLTSVDVNDFTSGVYFISISNSNSTQTHKVIIR